MPCVLWGVACISLPEPTTAGDVVKEFRQALSPYVAQHDKLQPRVDLYRLVPIADEDGAYRLSGEERVIAHLPDSNFSCAEIEDICMQRDDAELRCNRVSEALSAMVVSMDSEEECSLPSEQCHGGKRPNMLDQLRKENQLLRSRLDQSDVLLKEQQETAAMLHREFKILIHEVMPLASATAAVKSLAPAAPRDSAGQDLVSSSGGCNNGAETAPLRTRPIVPRIGGLGGIAAAIHGDAPVAAPAQLWS